MTEEEKMRNSIKLFENKKIRSVWDEEKEELWLSVVDVVGALTEQADARGATFYWSKMKQRMKEEGAQLLTNCQQLKIEAEDGKMRLTDVATPEGILRIIQSIPSKKAEPFKRWLAQVGSERLDQMADPEKSIQQALLDYQRLGYSENWINQRLKSIEIRKDLTDTWDKHGVSGNQYASLTDIIYKTWAGKTAREYKNHKGLRKENFRDNMTNGELLMSMLAEYSTTSITKSKNPKSYEENADCAVEGGNVAKLAREQLEARTGEKIVSELNASEIRSEKLVAGEIDEKNGEEPIEEVMQYKNNIAILRRMRGLTQVYMAKRLGIARQTYINIEKGQKELTLSQIEILKETLNVSFDDLLGVDTENGNLDYKKFLN